MKNKRISIRYAKALFDSAQSLNVTHECYIDMKLVLDVCHHSKNFIKMLVSPLIREEKKIVIVDQIFKDKIQDISLRFIELIINRRRELNIQNIALAYIELYKEFKNIKTIKLFTAVPINEEIRKRVIEIFEKKTNSEIELEENVDKKLIGGIVIKTDDYLYDDSLAGKVRKLKADFSKNIYERNF